MVPCHITIDTVPQIILNSEKDLDYCDDTVVGDSFCRETRQQRRYERNEEEEKPQTIGTGILAVAANRHHKYFCYLTKKLTAITIVVVALCAVSSVSAFTQPQNRRGAGKSTCAAPGRTVPSGTIIHSKASFLTPSKLASTFSTKKSLSSTRLFMSTENKSPKSADQQEWRAVFLALQLYKAAYGDLKVPPHFVVPAAAPWPGMFVHSVCFPPLSMCAKSSIYSVMPKQNKTPITMERNRDVFGSF
jgi:hypothetical protein